MPDMKKGDIPLRCPFFLIYLESDMPRNTMPKHIPRHAMLRHMLHFSHFLFFFKNEGMKKEKVVPHWWYLIGGTYSLFSLSGNWWYQKTG